MNFKLQKWISSLAAAAACCLVATVLLTIFAAGPALARQSHWASIVIDANSGEVLQSSNADRPHYPASLTKMMTLYLLFEQIEAGKFSLKSPLTVSAYAARQPPTRLGVKPGETIPVEAAIMSLITRSANDVSVVIAENIAGDVDSFARRMTAKARQIGMTHALFRNPNGLPNPEQVTTARDMAILGRSLFERFPKFSHFFARTSFTYRGHVIRNHNKLLGRVDGVDGIKTGYTRASGFNLVTSMHRNGRHMIAAVLGGPTGPSRDARMRELVNAYAPKLAARKTNYSLAARSLSHPGNAPDEKVEVAAAEAATAVTPTPRPAEEESASAVDGDDEETAADQAPAAPVRAAAAPTQQIASLPPVRASATPWQVAATQVQSVQDIRPRTGSILQWRTGAQPAHEPTASVPTASVPAASVPAAPAASAPASPAAVARAESKAKPTPAPVEEEALSGWVVQIAATNSETEAQRILKEARDSVGRTLRAAKPVTERVAKGSQTLYRARFAGFSDKNSAEKACAALKRSDYSCLTLKL